jgi:GAF domain-containing protein
MSVPDDVELSVALHGAMTQTDSLDETLALIAAVACRAVEGCESTGITMSGSAKPHTVACHGPHALPLDEAQYADDVGPCLVALRENTTVAVERIGDMQGRWPTYAERADELGVHSSLSMPLSVGGQPFGTMNMYATPEGTFTDEVQGYAHLFAAEAALAIHNASEYWRARNLVQNLERALDSRDLIGQAKGILMARLHLTPAQAFEVMRSASQRRNIKLVEIAEEIARTGEPPA